MWPPASSTDSKGEQIVEFFKVPKDCYGRLKEILEDVESSLLKGEADRALAGVQVIMHGLVPDESVPQPEGREDPLRHATG